MISFQIPFSEMDFSYVRSRGPGGQNVNRTNSAAVLRWNLAASQVFSEEQKGRLLAKLASQLTEDGDLIIRSDVHRDQDQNRSECIARLHALLRKALFVPKRRVATKPTRSSVKKRLDSKRRHAEVKASRQKIKD